MPHSDTTFIQHGTTLVQSSSKRRQIQGEGTKSPGLRLKIEVKTQIRIRFTMHILRYAKVSYRAVMMEGHDYVNRRERKHKADLLHLHPRYTTAKHLMFLVE